ncbi:MAG: hypothetical protein EPN88_02220 [Bacteroidetes bacterium]|nr:MAG: hypothetical protein EPN88_02220 [Bacteroidota bacterium]
MYRISNAIILIIIFSFTSCIKERFDSRNFDASLNLTPGLAVPVGYSHLGIEKYLNDTTIKEIRIAPDGFLSLYYSTSVVSGIMSDLLTFPPISVNNTLLNQTGVTIDLQSPGPTIDVVDSLLIPVSLVQTTSRIDSIQLLTGSLQVNLTSTSLTGTVTYQFPGLRLNGVAFTLTRSFSNPGFTLPLANYKIIPEHDAGGNNILKCNLSIHLQNPSGPINNGSAILNVQAGLNTLGYEAIWGDFSGYNISLPSFQFTTDIFNQLAGGHFEFADPGLKLIFSNSVGVPLSLSFSQFDAIDQNNNHYSLTGTGIPTLANPKIIGYPSLSQMGQTVKDSLFINKTNSNLPDILASNPNSINMAASASIIPAGGNGTTFINHDSKYDVTAAIELPLWGKAGFLTLTDTLAFNYLSTTLPVPEELERVIVHINITNSFPVTIYPQVFLLDENRVLLDSLFTGNEKVEGASDTNNDGIADPLVQDPVNIDLPRAKIDILNRTRYLVTRGKIMTTNYPVQDVRFYSSYYLNYNIGLIAQLKINTGSK